MNDALQAPTRGLKQLGGMVGSVLLTATFAILLAQAGGILGAVGVGLAILMAAFLIGVLLGFLFSVPRSAGQAATVVPGGSGGDGSAAAAGSARLLHTNTNLDHISDWLGTLLVGIGLSQIGEINDGLLRFRHYIGEYQAGGSAYASALEVISPLLLLIGLSSGFLAMYLYTRVVLAEVLSDAESALDKPLPRRVQSAVALVAREARSEGADTPAVAAVADRAGSVTTGEGVSAMYDLLYEPDGYRRVIAIGKELATTPARQLVTYWFYLAAAYGQAMSAALEAGNDAEAEEARKNALNAAQQAVNLSPAYRLRLWRLSNPDSEDNDLAPLRDDPEFRRIVRR